MNIKKLKDEKTQEKMREILGKIRYEKDLSKTKMFKMIGISQPSYNWFMSKKRKVGHFVLSFIADFIKENGYTIEEE